jgi:hypothetical protein
LPPRASPELHSQNTPMPQMSLGIWANVTWPMLTISAHRAATGFPNSFSPQSRWAFGRRPWRGARTVMLRWFEHFRSARYVRSWRRRGKSLLAIRLCIETCAGALSCRLAPRSQSDPTDLRQIEVVAATGRSPFNRSPVERYPANDQGLLYPEMRQLPGKLRLSSPALNPLQRILLSVYSDSGETGRSPSRGWTARRVLPSRLAEGNCDELGCAARLHAQEYSVLAVLAQVRKQLADIGGV